MLPRENALAAVSANPRLTITSPESEAQRLHRRARCRRPLGRPAPRPEAIDTTAVRAERARTTTLRQARKDRGTPHNGTTRCQYQAMPPAPGMRTNDAIVCARLYVGLTPASAGSPSTACRSGPRTCRSTAPTGRSRSAFGLSRRRCRAPGTRDRPPPCRWRRSKCERRGH